MISPAEVISAHDFSANNRDMVGRCGCFYCKRTFDASEISRWVGEDTDRALCPYCHIDSVVPASKTRIDPEFLGAMHAHWFSVNEKI